MDTDQRPDALVQKPRRRSWLLAAAALVIAAGLPLHYLARGPAGDIAADAVYAVLVYLVLGILFVHARPVILAGIAYALCAAIEFSQLTGIPAALTAAFPPFRLLLGTTFATLDLLSYAMGVVVVMVVDVLLRRKARVERAQHAQ